MNKLKHILLTLMLIVCLPISAQTISGFKRVSVSVMPNDDTVLKSVGLNTSNELVWFTKLPQVNSDWNATSGPSQILNKPIIANPTFQSVLNAGKTAFAFDQEEHFRLTSQWYTGGPIHNTIFKRNSIQFEFNSKGYEINENGIFSIHPLTSTNTGFNIAGGGISLKTSPIGATGTIKTDQLQSNHTFQLPSTSGTFPMTINGQMADIFGNINISGGSLPSHLEYNSSNKTIWNNGFGDQGLNTTYGENSLISNAGGYANTAIGSNTLKSTTTGSSNTALGSDTMKLNTTGGNNIAIGDRTLPSNTTGSYNTVVGTVSMDKNISGADNVVMGFGSLSNNISGNNNLVLGNSTLGNNTVGNDNIVLGSIGMYHNTTGSGNIAIGKNSGTYIGSSGTSPNTVSDQSIYIGENARPEASGQTNQIVIGRLAYGGGSNTVTVGNNNVSKTILKGIIETNGSYKLQDLNIAPTSSSDVGILGEIRVTADYIYVCTATNTWVRSALTTW